MQAKAVPIEVLPPAQPAVDHRPVDGAPIHALSALLLVAVDSLWVVFDWVPPVWIVAIPFCFVAVFVPTFLIQRHLKRDTTQRALTFATLLAVLAAIPTPITGTPIGLGLLAWTGLSKFFRRSSGKIVMSWVYLGAFCASCAFSATAALGATATDSIVQRPWFEARTAHFNTYSCAPNQEVSRLMARLEQFREAYSVMAGAQAVASPPIIVMAFPDHAAMGPSLPLYQGKPANLAAFFHRGRDENLIDLSLADSSAESMEVIFHEYTHLLLRHNEQFWPMWLKEGMAEIYATFAVTGSQGVVIGRPIAHHLRLLAQQPLMPLKDLFVVTHESPNYNEQEHQGIFYAQSWLLTHYLMLGENGSHKAGFGQLTVLLRMGQSPEQAFTNALRTSLPAFENQLRRYLERGNFQPLALAMNADLFAPRSLATRPLSTVETCCRLGDQLLRVGRVDSAEAYFVQAQKIAPR